VKKNNKKQKTEVRRQNFSEVSVLPGTLALRPLMAGGPVGHPNGWQDTCPPGSDFCFLSFVFCLPTSVFYPLL
jgi:hypothetical protein